MNKAETFKTLWCKFPCHLTSHPSIQSPPNSLSLPPVSGKVLFLYYFEVCVLPPTSFLIRKSRRSDWVWARIWRIWGFEDLCGLWFELRSLRGLGIPPTQFNSCDRVRSRGGWDLRWMSRGGVPLQMNKRGFRSYWRKVRLFLSSRQQSSL